LLPEAQPPTETGPVLLPTEHVQPAPDEQTASEEEPAGQDHPATTDDRSLEAEPPPAPDEPTAAAEPAAAEPAAEQTAAEQTAAEPAAAEPATTYEVTTPELPQPAQDEPAQDEPARDEQPTAPEPPSLDAPEPAAASGTEPPPAEAEAEAEPDLLRQVTVVPGVARYHNAQCILIRFMGEDDLNRMTLGEARQAGCTPCRACQPDQPGVKPELPSPSSQTRASADSMARRSRSGADAAHAERATAEGQADGCRGGPVTAMTVVL
jgi:hypothetical protein